MYIDIPTSLAYGAVTSLNPVHGLYSTFFPSLAYITFATSKHLSVGTFAILSIMVYSTIIRLETKYMGLTSILTSVNSSNDTNRSSTYDYDARLMDVKLMIATALSFWCGIVQVI